MEAVLAGNRTEPCATMKIMVDNQSDPKPWEPDQQPSNNVTPSQPK